MSDLRTVKLREQSRLPALDIPKATKPCQRVYVDTLPITDSDLVPLTDLSCSNMMTCEYAVPEQHAGSLSRPLADTTTRANATSRAAFCRVVLRDPMWNKMSLCETLESVVLPWGGRWPYCET